MLRVVLREITEDWLKFAYFIVLPKVFHEFFSPLRSYFCNRKNFCYGDDEISNVARLVFVEQEEK